MKPATKEWRERRCPGCRPAGAVLLAVLVLSLPASSLGQYRGDRYWFDASLTATAEYTSNVSLLADLDEDELGDDLDDFVFGIYPGLAMGYMAERTEWDIGYGTDFIFHYEDSDRDMIWDNHYAGFHLRQELSPRFTFRAMDSFAASSNPMALIFRDEEAAEDVSVDILTSRIDVITNLGLAELEWRASRRSTLRFQASVDITRYTDVERDPDDPSQEEIEFHDSDTYTGRIEYAYSLQRNFYIVAQPTASLYRYEGLGEAWSCGALILGRYRVSEDMHAEAGAGAAFVDENVDDDDRDDIEDTQEWSYLLHAGLNWVFRTSTITLEGGHDFAPSGGMSGTARRWSARIQGTHNFTEAFMVLGGGTYSRYRSVSGSTVDTETFTANARAAYQFTPWLSSWLEYTFLHQKVSDDLDLGEDLDTHRVILAVRVSLPESRRSGDR